MLFRAPTLWDSSRVPLKGKVCVVTGASRGIGRACAEELRSAGARVAVCASRAAPAVPTGVFSEKCDVSDSAEVARFFREVERHLGPPDVVVLNAGVLERGPIEDFTEEQWDRVLGVNLKAAFLCPKAACPALPRTPGPPAPTGSVSGSPRP